MIMVSDMERSVRFYRDVLGLKLKFQSPEWTEFDVDSTTLALHGGGKPQPAPAREQFAGTASIGFNVANLDSTCEDLKHKGSHRLPFYIDTASCALQIRRRATTRRFRSLPAR